MEDREGGEEGVVGKRREEEEERKKRGVRGGRGGGEEGRGGGGGEGRGEGEGEGRRGGEGRREEKGGEKEGRREGKRERRDKKGESGGGAGCGLAGRAGRGAGRDRHWRAPCAVAVRGRMSRPFAIANAIASRDCHLSVRSHADRRFCAHRGCAFRGRRAHALQVSPASWQASIAIRGRHARSPFASACRGHSRSLMRSPVAIAI